MLSLANICKIILICKQFTLLKKRCAHKSTHTRILDPGGDVTQLQVSQPNKLIFSKFKNNTTQILLQFDGVEEESYLPHPLLVSVNDFHHPGTEHHIPGIVHKFIKFRIKFLPCGLAI